MDSPTKTDKDAAQERWCTYGQGPTTLGMVFSGLNTTKQLAIGFFSSYQYQPSCDPIALKAQKRLAHAGMQLGGSDVYHYIEGLAKEHRFNVIHTFYLMQGSSINSQTLEDIIQSLELEAGKFKEIDLPLIIPLVFDAQSFWEISHITLIIIKDNTVEYYDSKGILSQNRKLQNTSLHDLLSYCQAHFTDNGSIVENPYAHQFDAHNCGVFVCRHLYTRFVLNRPLDTLDTPSIEEIQNFRAEVLRVAYPEKDLKALDTDDLSKPSESLIIALSDDEF